MKSAGKAKGYKCPRCGAKVADAPKEKVEILRNLQEGFYEVPPSARRHLSKPLVRILGRE
jgi:tRNA(Ile2)-agmatinylcytidine synthase